MKTGSGNGGMMTVPKKTNDTTTPTKKVDKTIAHPAYAVRSNPPNTELRR